MSDEEEVVVIDTVGPLVRVTNDVFVDPREVAVVFRQRAEQQTAIILKSGRVLELGKGNSGPRAEHVRRVIATAIEETR